MPANAEKRVRLGGSQLVPRRDWTPTPGNPGSRNHHREAGNTASHLLRHSITASLLPKKKRSELSEIAPPNSKTMLAGCLHPGMPDVFFREPFIQLLVIGEEPVLFPAANP